VQGTVRARESRHARTARRFVAGPPPLSAGRVLQVSRLIALAVRFHGLLNGGEVRN